MQTSALAVLINKRSIEETHSLTAKDAKDAEENNSLTAKDAKAAKEHNSLTAKAAKDAKGRIIRANIKRKVAKTTPRSHQDTPSEITRWFERTLEYGGDMTRSVSCLPPLARHLRDLQVLLWSLLLFPSR
jgi:hypothetical protein